MVHVINSNYLGTWIFLNRAQAIVLNKTSDTTLVTGFRSQVYNFDPKLVQFNISDQLNISINVDYYDEIVDGVELIGEDLFCVPYEPRLPPLEGEMCNCYSQIRAIRKDISEDDSFGHCLEFNSWVYKGSAFLNKTTIFHSLRFLCEDRYVIRDLAMVAIDNRGYPVGQWEDIHRDDFDDCIIPYDKNVRHVLRKPLRPYRPDCNRPNENLTDVWEVNSLIIRGLRDAVFYHRFLRLYFSQPINSNVNRYLNKCQAPIPTKSYIFRLNYS